MTLLNEIDHLDGILFLERMPNLLTLSGLDEYKKFCMKSEKVMQEAQY